MRRRKILSGFTLIELLVVVTIIVLLLAMLSPALNRAIQAAQEVQCLSQLHQLHLGATGYTSDNFGMLPPPFGVAPGATVTAYPDGNWWWYPEWFIAYQPSRKLQLCPNDIGWPDGGFMNPLNSHAQFDHNSYYLNIAQISGSGWSVRSLANHRQMTLLPKPSAVVLLCEWPAIVGFSWHRPKIGAGAQYNNAESNIAFVDGHVAVTEIFWGSGWSQWYNPPNTSYDYLWDPYP